MYNIEIKPSCQKDIEKLCNKNPILSEALEKKMNKTNITLNSRIFQNSTDYIIKILATDGINTNKTTFGRFSIINSPGLHVLNTTNNSVAFLSSSGSIFLKGTCTNQTTCTAPSNSFKITNSSGDVKMYIDTTSGNMCIKSSISCQNSDQQTSCSSPNNSFIIKDVNNNEVIVIDRTNGNLCLTGKMYENKTEVP